MAQTYNSAGMGPDPTTLPSDQLQKAVSPLEELMMPRPEDPSEMARKCPLEKATIPLDPNRRPLAIHEYREDVQARGFDSETGREGVPVIVEINSWGDGSEISLEAFSSESRTLTPHPSFGDDPAMTAKDFHHLFQAARLLHEQDWPSDEDRDPEEYMLMPTTDETYEKRVLLCDNKHQLTETDCEI